MRVNRHRCLCRGLSPLHRQLVCAAVMWLQPAIQSHSHDYPPALHGHTDRRTPTATAVASAARGMASFPMFAIFTQYSLNIQVLYAEFSATQIVCPVAAVSAVGKYCLWKLRASTRHAFCNRFGRNRRTASHAQTLLLTRDIYSQW